MLTKQGDAGDELYLILDGVVSVDVDGNAAGRLGPARSWGSARCWRVAGVPPPSPPSHRCGSPRRPRRHRPDKLRTLADSHHREDLGEADDSPPAQARGTGIPVAEWQR